MRKMGLKHQCPASNDHIHGSSCGQHLITLPVGCSPGTAASHCGACQTAGSCIADGKSRRCGSLVTPGLIDCAGRAGHFLALYAGKGALLLGWRGNPRPCQIHIFAVVFSCNQASAFGLCAIWWPAPAVWNAWLTVNKLVVAKRLVLDNDTGVARPAVNVVADIALRGKEKSGRKRPWDVRGRGE